MGRPDVIPGRRLGARLRAAVLAGSTRQTWTALAAATAFVALAAALVVAPVPYVSWRPGGAQDALGTARNRPLIDVEGAPTHPTTGRLDFTYVSETAAASHLSLPEALLAYVLPGWDSLPRDAIYPPGVSAGQVEREQTQQMETSQSDAVVAALRAAGQPVTEHPAATDIVVRGPAYDRLRPGDLVVSVDGAAVSRPAQVDQLLAARPAGARVTFGVLRDRVRTRVSVTSRRSAADDPSDFGVRFATGYSYAPRVTFGVDPAIGGPSAGFVFSLALYDKLTPGALLAGRHVAGTGTITAAGQVGPIGGIQEKITAAQRAGATVFLVPQANCGDLVGFHPSASLVRVASLRQGVAALRAIVDPAQAARVPRC